LASAKDELIVRNVFFHVHLLVIEKMGDVLGNFHDVPPFFELIKNFDIGQSNRLLLRIPKIYANGNPVKDTFD